MAKYNRDIVTNDLTDRKFYLSDDGISELINSYNERSYPVFYGHNYNDMSAYVGYSVPGSAKKMSKNGVNGVNIEFMSLDTKYGKEFSEILDSGAPMGYSVGIKIEDYEYDESSDLVVIKSASGMEFSATPIPTDKNTFGDEISYKFSIDGLEISGDTLVATFAKWDTKYINDLPDSSFAVIESDYKENKTARHLPYKDKDGNVDLPHLRNALARMNQLTPVGKDDTAEELRAKAKKVLTPLAKKYLPNSKWAKMSIETEVTKMDEEKGAKFVLEGLKKALLSAEAETVEEPKPVEVKEEAKLVEVPVEDSTKDKTETFKDISELEKENEDLKKQIAELKSQLKKTNEKMEDAKYTVVVNYGGVPDFKEEPKKIRLSEAFK